MFYRLKAGIAVMQSKWYNYYSVYPDIRRWEHLCLYTGCGRETGDYKNN